jgi:hypothetical protein
MEVALVVVAVVAAPASVAVVVAVAAAAAAAVVLAIFSLPASLLANHLHLLLRRHFWFVPDRRRT